MLHSIASVWRSRREASLASPRCGRTTVPRAATGVCCAAVLCIGRGDRWRRAVCIDPVCRLHVAHVSPLARFVVLAPLCSPAASGSDGSLLALLAATAAAQWILVHRRCQCYAAHADANE